MNAGKIELSDLGRLVLAERSRRGISLREAALAIGIRSILWRGSRRGTYQTFISSSASPSGVAPISSNSSKSRKRQLLPPM